MIVLLRIRLLNFKRLTAERDNLMRLQDWSISYICSNLTIDSLLLEKFYVIGKKIYLNGILC